MSVTFYVRATDLLFLNVANGNARDLLQFLGLDSSELCGEIQGARLRKCIATARTKQDRGRLGLVDSTPGRSTLIIPARPPERMNKYLAILEELCTLAGDLGRI